jgi:hypothetical protein
MRLYYWIGLLLILSSCGKNKIQNKEIILSEDFNILTIDSRFDVVLTQSTTQSILISGHPRSVESVEYSLTGNELRIKSRGGNAWLRPKSNRTTLYISVKELKRININETGSLECSNELTGNEIGLVTTGKLAVANLKLNCGTFYFWNNFPCGGKITLEGEVEVLKLWNHALMQVDALQLNTLNSEIENNSQGDISTSTANSIKYSIKGSGNIKLKGNPPLIVPLSSEGSGQLIQL